MGPDAVFPLWAMDPWTLIALLLAAGLAGFVDAVVGGGGLIQLPSLLALLPAQAPAVLLGTNKLSSIVGTAAAAARYLRRIHPPWRALLPAAGFAFTGAFAGAWCVSRVPADLLRRAIPFLLLAVLVDTLRHRELGVLHQPRLSPRAMAAYGAGLGLVIGFYDGFFGPGTGSFLVFAFVRVFGFDFLHASAGAKCVNLATNAAALCWFAPSGRVLIGLGLAMALANLAGALVGSRLALLRGAGFVRAFFLVVVTALLARTGWNAFFR